ncbi:hypothetical protein GS532_22740 [Rhodococcus hoagii]|nr:hypothetical protein [Prescottella equi]
MDAIKFPGKGAAPLEELELEWPKFARESDLAKAQTVQAWSVASGGVDEDEVAYLHEDWDDERVQEEADLIDNAKTVTEPLGTFGFGTDQPPLPTENDPARTLSGRRRGVADGAGPLRSRRHPRRADRDVTPTPNSRSSQR